MNVRGAYRIWCPSGSLLRRVLFPFIKFVRKHKLRPIRKFRLDERDDGQLICRRTRVWYHGIHYIGSGSAMAITRDLRRMARLRAGGMSFGSALVVGIGLGHALSRPISPPKYNGKGFAGDHEAIANDFHTAIDKVAPPAKGS